MKKLLFILVIAAGGIYSTSQAAFSNEKMSRFLNRMDDYSRRDSDQACALLDEAMTFTLVDHSVSPAMNKSGGKKELCRYLSVQELMLRNAPIADRHYFANLQIKRNWKDWKKATLHYEVHHDIEVFPMRNVIRSMSSEDMALVKDGDNFRITRWDIVVSLK